MSASRLQNSIERKAYAYGVSEAVSTLLGEYVIELIQNTYVKHTEKPLASSASGQS